MTRAGSGKTRFYAKPNLMQANTSFVVLDPKGELLRDTAASMLLMALMFYLLYEAPKDEQNFPMVMELFQQLFYIADYKHGGSLPVHVHFLMDEFANLSLPDDFDKLLAVMRAREISVSIILQNIAQIKALFERQWESIFGNCDEFLYLGGNEQGSHKYVSELLGKETIDVNTYGKSTGHSGNYSTNYQLSGRELLTPDEVRMLDNRYAIFFIRGERPVMDEKFDILKHPNVELTTDGKAEPYRHGEVTEAVAGISLWNSLEGEVTESGADAGEYEILSEEDLENMYSENGGKKNDR